MKLIGISRINSKYNLQFYDIQKKKSHSITWNKTMKDDIVLKDFYKINRIDTTKRSIILKSKIEVKCKEKKELNLLCNENNEYVLKMFKNKPIKSRMKSNKNNKKYDKLAGRPTSNPFAKAMKKNRNDLKIK